MSSQAPKPDIVSKIMEIAGQPLADLRGYSSPLFHECTEEIVARTAHIPITASGSQGAKRVE